MWTKAQLLVSKLEKRLSVSVVKATVHKPQQESTDVASEDGVFPSRIPYTVGSMVSI